MAKIYNEVWPHKKRTTGEVIRNQEFSLIDMNSPIFTDVDFIGCVFNDVTFGDARLYNCNFQNCNFTKVDLRNATIGANDGIYDNCTFKKCDFRKGYFYKPVMVNCLFDDCKFKSVDFKASAFNKCKFIGKLNDVIFHGDYISKTTEGASPNLMVEVDFFETTWSYVCFEHCDLSSCIPPNGSTFEQLLSPSPYMNDVNYLCTHDDNK